MESLDTGGTKCNRSSGKRDFKLCGASQKRRRFAWISRKNRILLNGEGMYSMWKDGEKQNFIG